MRRRTLRNLLKNTCVLLGLGFVFLPSIIILLDWNSRSAHKKPVTSRTTKSDQLQYSRTTTARNIVAGEFYATSRENQPDSNVLSRSQKTLLQTCVQRDPDNSGFQEIILGSVLYSAFLDKRLEDQTFIRVISILPSYGVPAQMYCHFQDQKTNKYFTSWVEVEGLGASQGLSYVGFLASCDIPTQIDTTALCSVNISLHPEADSQTDKNTKVIPLHAAEHRADTTGYHLCVPPITGQISVTRLVEFVEQSRILGVTHLTFYHLKGTDNGISEVLTYYKHKGLVTLLPWDPPYYIRKNIYNSGQGAAINDCLYRSIGKFAFAVVCELNEFLVPVGERTVPQMLERFHQDDDAGHCFKSYTFNTFNAPGPSNSPSQLQLITQRFNFRTKTANTQLSRCIVSPDRIFSLHTTAFPNPLEEFYSVREIDPSIGHVVRYSKCGEYGEEDCVDLTQDLTMAKYREDLGMKFKSAMSYLKKQGTA